MHEPIIRVQVQRHDFDCGVACLAMLLGTSYEDTLVAFNSLQVLVKGCTVKQLRRAARYLGHRLTIHRHVDLEADTGILCVRRSDWTTDHLVVLKEGMIIDTDATVWDAEDYLAAQKAKVVDLLVRAT